MKNKRFNYTLQVYVKLITVMCLCCTCETVTFKLQMLQRCFLLFRRKRGIKNTKTVSSPKRKAPKFLSWKAFLFLASTVWYKPTSNPLTRNPNSPTSATNLPEPPVPDTTINQSCSLPCLLRLPSPLTRAEGWAAGPSASRPAWHGK